MALPLSARGIAVHGLELSPHMAEQLLAKPGADIVPQLRRAHAIVNSFLPYELPVMKARVATQLGTLIEEFAADPARQDAHERAVRVKGLFDQIPAVEDESLVPPGSLLREFIGGSSFVY